jgi:glycolate oxidase iron-sulfur subunit
MKNTVGRNALERYKRDVSRCVRCGACSTVCPSFLADRRESRSPRGRMALIEAVLKGALPTSQLYRDRLSTCTGCLACESACASGVPVTSIIHAAKEQAVREAGRGVISAVIAAGLRHPGLMRPLAWLAPVALHFGKDAVAGKGHQVHGSRSSVQREQKKDRTRTRVAFFPGCAVEYFQRDIAAATAFVLEGLGYEVVVPRGLQCCGRPFLSLGDRDAAVDLARKNARILAALDVDAVVTACASCGMTFKKEYPGLLKDSGSVPVAVLDIHEFLADRLGGLDLGRMEHPVTWHDPCHLGRGQGLAGTARAVLRSVPGLPLVEMSEPERCCGFGGVMRATHPSFSAEIGEAKAKDIKRTGAAIVVTGCPGCRMQIADSLARIGSKATVVHTVQVIAEAMGDRGQETGVRRESGVLLSSGS